ELEFPLLPTDVERADALLAGLPRPLIGVHPWSRDAWRRWPPDRFGAVAEALRRRCGGAIVFLADSEGVQVTAGLAAAAGPRSRNLAGRTSLLTLAGVISRLDLLLTNDSGPAHIAFALGTPAVVIASSLEPDRYCPTES